MGARAANCRAHGTATPVQRCRPPFETLSIFRCPHRHPGLSPLGMQVVREFTSHGARIIESDARLVGPEDQPDLFEGENMEVRGREVVHGESND